MAEKALGLQKAESKGFIRAIRILMTFAIVCFAWILFRSPTIMDTFNIIVQILTLYKGFHLSLEGVDMLSYLAVAFVPFFIFEFMHEFYKNMYDKMMNFIVVRWGVYIVLFSMIVLIGVFDGSEFIYANF